MSKAREAGHQRGRVALVTGASRGIGRACALRLAADGADLALGYLMNESQAQQVAEEIRGLGRRAICVQGDIRSTGDLRRLVAESVEALGGLDVVVANAALGVLKPALSIRDSQWDMTMETNVRSLLALAREAVPHLQARGGGHLITLSSLGASRCTPDYAAIGTAKAAIEALTRYLALELAASNIRVNCVSGGPVDTDALRYVIKDPAQRSAVAKGTPLGRLGLPEDLAGVVAFLCSPDADWIIGQTLIADGGLSLR